MTLRRKVKTILCINFELIFFFPIVWLIFFWNLKKLFDSQFLRVSLELRLETIFFDFHAARLKLNCALKFKLKNILIKLFFSTTLSILFSSHNFTKKKSSVDHAEINFNVSVMLCRVAEGKKNGKNLFVCATCWPKTMTILLIFLR